MNPVMPLSGCFKFTDADLEGVYSMMGGTPIEIPIKRPPLEWRERYDAIKKEIGCHINGEYLVHYSLYGKDQDDLPVNNLHEKAINGKVIFIGGHNRCMDDGKGFISEPYFDPTWLDVAIAANDFLNASGNHQHVYLEGILTVSESHNIKCVTFVFGS